MDFYCFGGVGMKKIISVALVATLAAGCSYKGHLESKSSAALIDPSTQVANIAKVRFDSDIDNIEKSVSVGYVCSAHNFLINTQNAISQSIIKTLEGGFRSVEKLNSNASSAPGSYFFSFSLDDFSPRLRFDPGFWGARPEASTDISLKIHVKRPDGSVAYQGLISGVGRSHSDGMRGCPDGMKAVEEATGNAIKKATDDLVMKVFSTNILKK